MLLLLLMLPLLFNKLFVVLRMGFEVWTGVVIVYDVVLLLETLLDRPTLGRPIFRCLEFRTLARLLLLARLTDSIEVDVEVG